MSNSESSRPRSVGQEQTGLEQVNIGALGVIVTAARQSFDAGQLRYLAECFSDLAREKEAGE